MKSKPLILIVFCLSLTYSSLAQKDTADVRKPDIVNLGFGIGFDYGGIGGDLMVYPQKNIGIL